MIQKERAGSMDRCGSCGMMHAEHNFLSHSGFRAGYDCGLTVEFFNPYQDTGKRGRLVFMVLGILSPFIIGALIICLGGDINIII